MNTQEEQWLLQEKYNGVKSDAFYADCKTLALGEPLAYLIGSIPFLDCTIHLDEQPLIPRVETEFWTEKAIEAIKEKRNLQPNLADEFTHTSRVLDLCAGSGCIGVAVAKTIENIVIDFGELSKRLIPTIEKNCESNGITADRRNIYHSNLFSAIPPEAKYDFILSNPPYIDPAIDRATKSVKSHEPHLALYGGTAGMEVIEQLIKVAPTHLVSGGQLWIEHEPEQVAAIAVAATASNFSCISHPDQYEIIRYSVLVLQ
jgi:HemK-like putative methylase